MSVVFLTKCASDLVKYFLYSLVKSFMFLSNKNCIQFMIDCVSKSHILERQSKLINQIGAINQSNLVLVVESVLFL